jgi:fibrillarin-like pre-rRNA processing protein
MEIPNFFRQGKFLYTRNLRPGISQFSEALKTINGVEYREWDAKRSKLAAAIVKGANISGLKEDSVVLYLGASHGYTPSFVSDICAKGKIFALDFAPRVVRDLVYLCENRKNICPILGNANHPENYMHKVAMADVVYMDIAQKNQAEIFLKNIRMFLKPRGTAMIAVKARSIDVAEKPDTIFRNFRKDIEAELNVIDSKNLAPLEKDHMFFIVERKS